MARYPGKNEKASLVLRLRGVKDYGWNAVQHLDPPAIQVEAADELVRMQGQLDIRNEYLVTKGLWVEFLRWTGDV